MDNNYNGLEIAVIGMSGKFPKSKDLHAFWENLKQGQELITFFSEDELAEAGISKELLKNPKYVKAQGYLEDCEFFDAFFFGYTPDEAEVMDPQMRLFYEYSWKALEDAGTIPNKFKGLIGVYAGASNNFDWEASRFLKGQDSWENLQIIDKDHLAARIAYKLNLKGPALTIFTACSTSLVTINTACLGILSGQCDIAIAGGVTIHPEKLGYLYEEEMISSPDGHNRTFDENAGGTLGGSGIGVVVLKRLQDAIDDGDHIYATIKGTAINNDGNRKVGFTAPSIEGQAEVIRNAMQMAEVEPESIGYVECHGTATNLGDPVEVEGLKLAFNSQKRNYCALGSVKSNTGHLDSAAGVIGFIKTALCLKNRMLVPSLHFKNPNPKMDLGNSPFYVNTKTVEWKSDKYPLRAGVTSLGVGGTNAHAILEEPPQEKTSLKSRDNKLILISGKTKSALENNVKNLKEFISKNANINLADVAYTLQIGREHFSHRKMVVCGDIDDFLKEIDHKSNISGNIVKSTKTNVVFMFSGQGSQYVQMGRGLYEKEPHFKENFDLCSEILKRKLKFDIREILFAEEDQINDSNSKIDQVLYTQPIKFAFEYSIAKLLIELGIKPNYMIGHSFGEIGAACLSGVFNLEDALEVVALRAELMDSVEPGLMMSVNMTEKKVNEYISKHKEISLAAVNGTELCIVSGTIKGIEEFEKTLNKDGYDTLMLKVPRAGHSNMMIPIMEKFRERISQMKLNKPNIPYISGLSGDWVTNEQATSDKYWSSHLKESIRFSDGLSKLLKKGDTVFVQLGPDRGLVSFVEIHEEKNNSSAINIIRHKKEIIDDNKYFASQIGELWLRGVDINWEKYYEGEKRNKLSLPTYEFDKHKFESQVDIYRLINQLLEKNGNAIRKRRSMSEWFYYPSWEQAPFLKNNTQILENQRFLVFCNESDLCKDTLSMLREKKNDVIEIWHSLEYKVIDNNKYGIRSNYIEDFNHLKNDFNKNNRLINKIIHFWNYGEINENIDGKVQETEINKGFGTFTNIVKELITLFGKESQIIAITSGAYSITDLETLCPERTMIGTILKVIGQENPDINTKIIDLDEIPTNPIIQLKKLEDEIFNRSKERVIAYRYGKRLVESYRPLNIDIKDKSKLLKKGGVYIITGGLGGIGLDIGKYLGNEYNAKVVLIGRSPFPERSIWDSWISEKGLSDKISKKINVIKEIEKNGGIVRIHNVDISDREKLEIVFNESQKEFGTVNGVFHFAGETNPDNFVTVANLTAEIIKMQFKPKVHGLNALRQIISKYSVDFCFVTSSVSSILGGMEFSAYACSNAYMDGFINSDLRNGDIPWINVDLDGWISNRNNEDASDQSNLYVSTDEGIRLIENILSIKECGIGYVIQSISNFNDRLNTWGTNVSETTWEPESNVESNLDAETLYYTRPELSTEYIEPRTEIEQKVTEAWNMFFRFEKIGVNDDFFELGGNSLKAMRLFAVLYKEFGIRISVKEIFNRPTIALMSEYINENTEELII